MKANPFSRTTRAGKLSRMMAVAAALALTASGVLAGEKAAPPPVPFHSVEGTSGVFLTDTAYFNNLPEGDDWFGRPVVGASVIVLGDKHLQAYTVNANFLKRVELGYSFMRLDLGDWPGDVRDATGLHPDGYVPLHTLSARVMLVEEGSWEQAWLPAITAGVRYKHNDSIWDIDDDLMGTCGDIGVADNDGWDFTLTASKTFADILPRPFILSAGVRSTESAQFGFLGFTDNRDVLFEASAVFFVTDRLIVGGEFRQKSDNLDRCLDLVGPEHDAWDIALGYVVNEHCTITGGYAHLGNVLNREENAAWALQIRWEF